MALEAGSLQSRFWWVRLLGKVFLFLLLFSRKVGPSFFATPCLPAGSSVHGIPQAGILKWVAISFSRGSSRPGIKPMSPALAGKSFTTESPRKPLLLLKRALSPSRGLIAFVLGPLSFFFFFTIYLFIYLASPGLVVVLGICHLCCSMETLSCSPWDLAPWPGIQPGPLLWEESLSHWTTREEVPVLEFLIASICEHWRNSPWDLGLSPGTLIYQPHMSALSSWASLLERQGLLDIHQLSVHRVLPTHGQEPLGELGYMRKQWGLGFKKKSIYISFMQ